MQDEGLSAVPGVRVSALSAGIYQDPERLDIALIECEQPVPAAAVFTQNNFCAAPVRVSQDQLKASGGRARAILVNAGCANAATGEPGLSDARLLCSQVARELGCSDHEVLIASTGIIGERLPLERMQAAIPTLVTHLSEDAGSEAARAIMTTDTHPKEASLSFEADGHTYTVGGMTKGSGMIAPNMATMLAFLATDAPLTSAQLQEALTQAVNKSFNCITVDSDTSTNDSCFLISTAAGEKNVASQNLISAFQEALDSVCIHLARLMARDGEGATKLVTVNVTGARSKSDAQLVARAIADSPLVKTAIFGRDANWGRIAAAAGRSGAAFEQENVDISIVGIPVLEDGLALGFDEDLAKERFEAEEIVIDIDLGAGQSNTTMWTCDLTHDYITINADYRS